MRVCRFFAVSLSRGGRVMQFLVGKVAFALLFTLIKISDLLSMGAVQTWASTQ